MSIFDIFTFKKELKEVVNQDFLKGIVEAAKTEIINQAKDKLADGLQKMNNVVDVVEVFIRGRIKSNNKIVLWLVDNILIPNVRLITQTVYDLLKEVVKGL